MTLGEGLGKQAIQMLLVTVKIHNRSLQFPLACIRDEMTIFFVAVYISTVPLFCMERCLAKLCSNVKVTFLQRTG